MTVTEAISRLERTQDKLYCNMSLEEKEAIRVVLKELEAYRGIKWPEVVFVNYADENAEMANEAGQQYMLERCKAAVEGRGK